MCSIVFEVREVDCARIIGRLRTAFVDLFHCLVVIDFLRISVIGELWIRIGLFFRIHSQVESNQFIILWSMFTTISHIKFARDRVHGSACVLRQSVVNDNNKRGSIVIPVDSNSIQIFGYVLLNVAWLDCWWYARV